MAALVAVVLVAGGCSSASPEPTPVPSAVPSAEPQRLPGPTFVGSYEVTAINVGTEGEPSWGATWTATPTCASGTCDTIVRIERPGFTTYEVTAVARGREWRWEPVIQFSCPGSGAPYTVASGGFRVRASDTRTTDDVGTVATQLVGDVRVRLVADGCPTMRLDYEVTAESLIR